MKGYLAMFGVAMIFGIFGVLINLNALMFGDYFQVFLRNVCALLILFGIAAIWKTSLRVSREHMIVLLKYGFLAVFAFVFISLAFVHADIKIVVAFRYVTTILISLLISGMFLRERLTTMSFLSAGLALLGIAVFLHPFSGELPIGAYYAILSSIAFVTSMVLIKKHAFSTEQMMLFEFGSVSVVLGAFIALTMQPTIGEFHWISVIATAIFVALLILLNYLIVYGFRNTNFNFANIAMTSEIFFGVLFGFLLLGQTIALLEFIGITMIFIAAILPHITKLMQSK